MVINFSQLGQGSGGGGTTNYGELQNKPQINGVTLDGNKTTEQLGIVVNGKMLEPVEELPTTAETGTVMALHKAEKRFVDYAGSFMNATSNTVSFKAYSDTAHTSTLDIIQARIPSQISPDTTVADLKVGDGGWSALTASDYMDWTEIEMQGIGSEAYFKIDFNSATVYVRLEEGYFDTVEGLSEYTQEAYTEPSAMGIYQYDGTEWVDHNEETDASILALEDDVDALSGNLDTLSGFTTGLNQTFNAVTVQTNNAISNLSGNVSTLSGNVSTINTQTQDNKDRIIEIETNELNTNPLYLNDALNDANNDFVFNGSLPEFDYGNNFNIDKYITSQNDTEMVVEYHSVPKGAHLYASISSFDSSTILHTLGNMEISVKDAIGYGVERVYFLFRDEAEYEFYEMPYDASLVRITFSRESDGRGTKAAAYTNHTATFEIEYGGKVNGGLKWENGYDMIEGAEFEKAHFPRLDAGSYEIPSSGYTVIDNFTTYNFLEGAIMAFSDGTSSITMYQTYKNEGMITITDTEGNNSTIDAFSGDTIAFGFDNGFRMYKKLSDGTWEDIFIADRFAPTMLELNGEMEFGNISVVDNIFLTNQQTLDTFKPIKYADNWIDYLSDEGHYFYFGNGYMTYKAPKLVVESPTGLTLVNSPREAIYFNGYKVWERPALDKITYISNTLGADVEFTTDPDNPIFNNMNVGTGTDFTLTFYIDSDQYSQAKMIYCTKSELDNAPDAYELLLNAQIELMTKNAEGYITIEANADLNRDEDYYAIGSLVDGNGNLLVDNNSELYQSDKAFVFGFIIPSR